MERSRFAVYIASDFNTHIITHATLNMAKEATIDKTGFKQFLFHKRQNEGMSSFAKYNVGTCPHEEEVGNDSCNVQRFVISEIASYLIEQ